MAAAYGLEDLRFGPDYLIPKPFDPRLIVELPAAVAEAAMETGVATRPLADLDAYRQSLSQRVIKTFLIMKPMFEVARADPQRLVYTDGEEERVLRAVQTVIDERLARPILIGRPDVIQTRIERLGLSFRLDARRRAGQPRQRPALQRLCRRSTSSAWARNGVTPQGAREVVRTRRSVIAAIMLARGEADAMLAGPVGRFATHLRHVSQVIGLRPEMLEASTVHALVLDSGALFIADTSVGFDPEAALIAETALKAAEIVRGFGLEPKVALVSHSDFGSRDTASARKMRAALALLRRAAPGLEVDGEMQADTALLPATPAAAPARARR